MGWLVDGLVGLVSLVWLGLLFGFGLLIDGLVGLVGWFDLVDWLGCC